MFCVLFGYGDELWPHKLAYGRIALRKHTPRSNIRADVVIGVVCVLELGGRSGLNTAARVANNLPAYAD